MRRPSLRNTLLAFAVTTAAVTGSIGVAGSASASAAEHKTYVVGTEEACYDLGWALVNDGYARDYTCTDLRNGWWQLDAWD